MVTVLVVLSVCEGLSLIGACSRVELLLAVVPLGTCRGGDGSPPIKGEGLLVFSYRFSIDLNMKFSVTKRVNTHIESGILEAGGGCWGEKSSLGLHHQIPPSPLPASPHQMTHLQWTKLLFFTCTKKYMGFTGSSHRMEKVSPL